MLSKTILFLGLVAIGLALPPIKPRQPPIQPRASSCAAMPAYMAGSRIVGGENAPSSIPWQVSFRGCSHGNCHFCGGTVLDAKTVLSAAHCTKPGSDLSNRYIMAGSNNRLSGGQVIQIEKGIWNAEMPWNQKTNQNDIVILKLKTALTFNDDVKPACLPDATLNLDATGQTCYVSGWGTLESGGKVLPEIVQYVDVPLITNDKCKTQYGASITDDMVCAGYDAGGKDSCQGDSGGPFVCKVGSQAVVYGVVSWGAGCASPNAAGVYARVTTFLTWIKANMESGTPSPPAPTPPTCDGKVDSWWGDNYCDDFMNTKACGFDNGDCCQANPPSGWNSYCKVCECIKE